MVIIKILMVITSAPRTWQSTQLRGYVGKMGKLRYIVRYLVNPSSQVVYKMFDTKYLWTSKKNAAAACRANINQVVTNQF